MGDRFEISLGQIIGFLRRGLVLATGLAIMGAAALFLYANRSAPIFESQAVMVAQNIQADLRTFGLRQGQNAALHIDAYRVIASSFPIVEASLVEVGKPAEHSDVEEFRSSRLRVEVDILPQVLYINASDPSPQVAAAIANAIAEQVLRWDHDRVTDELERLMQVLRQRIQAYQAVALDVAGATDPAGSAAVVAARHGLAEARTQLDSITALAANSSSAVRVLRAATPALKSLDQSPFVYGLIGLFGGVLFAYALLLLVETIDGRFYTTNAIERTTGLKALAELSRPQRGRALPQDDVLALQVNLESNTLATEIGPVIAVGVQRSDDSATVAAALAEGLTLRGVRTLLIDADLRRPAIARHYKLVGPPRVSLLEYVSSRQARQPPDALRIAERENLELLYETRPAPRDVVPFLNRMPYWLGRWGLEYPAIVLRVAPLVSASDALVLSAAGCSVILCVNPGTTNKHRLLGAVRVLQQTGVSILGVVTTGMQAKRGHERLPQVVPTSDAKATRSRTLA